MNKKNFDYKPLACNKNDREFKWDIKKDPDIPEDAVYVKMGDINSEMVRYTVFWGDGINIESFLHLNPSLDVKSIHVLH
jgi:hypothetical protein